MVGAPHEAAPVVVLVSSHNPVLTMLYVKLASQVSAVRSGEVVNTEEVFQPLLLSGPQKLRTWNS